MGEGILHKNYKAIVTFFGLAFLVGSIYIHTTGDFFWYRTSRGIIIFFFLGLLVYYQSKKINRALVYFLLLYGLSSVLTIWYENVISATWAMALSFLSYIVLLACLIPKVSFKKMTPLFLAIFLVTVVINGYLLYRLILMIKNVALSEIHYLFILLGAMALAVLGFISLLYNHKYSSRATLIFTFFVFSLIFSEVFRSIGYYDFIVYANISVYIARGLLIVALSMLLNYTIARKKSSEQLGLTTIKSHS